MAHFGEDEMDQFSEIVSSASLTSKSGQILGKVYTKIRRENEHTLGRSLGVVFDERIELDFTPVYSYLVRFNKKPSETIAPAGNHWHEHKQEFFIAASGEFRILLEDRESKERVEYILKSNSRDKNNQAIEQILYIPTFIAHAVYPLTNGESSLLVLASSPGAYGDTFPYTIE